MNDKYLTVTALTRYLKYKIESDSNLRTVYLKGEISNFKAHSTGHFYFSIKDENSIIKAIMFKSNASKLNFIPTEGMKVLVTGSISVYPQGGTYQIYVEDLIEDGVGNLYIAFEKLKEKLSKEGLFDKKYKKQIPKIPEKIGIVTAPTGAAVKDIISTIRRRFPYAETYLFPALVQGENAHLDIIKKVSQAESYNLDVLIVGRGGGSFEDMNCFNNEELARLIFSLNTPVISAVGHEIDYTIIDFVADLRAPTPTGAAEMAVPNVADVIAGINQYKIRLQESIKKKVKMNSLKLDALKNSFVIKNPMLMYNVKTQNLDNLIENLNKAMLNKIDKTKLRLNEIKNNYVLKNPDLLYKKHIDKLNNIIEKLELLNPISMLKKGYSLTYINDKVISSISDVKENDEINVRLSDGYINAKVEKVGDLDGKKD
ncbi:MAG: exodeoxyribonuclease VII large subunit [Bacilli bacterium]|nr:exodeoxyribonuclease VII large subunit [Bacilli bacterium]